MDSDYITEMTDLRTEYAEELTRNFDGKSISDLGIDDLEKLKERFEDISTRNLDVQARARGDSSFADTEALRNLLNAGEELDNIMAEAMKEVEKNLKARKLLEEAKKIERERISNERNLIDREIRRLKEMIVRIERLARDSVLVAVRDSYLQVALNLKEQVKNLNSFRAQLDDRLKTLDDDLNELRVGGNNDEIIDSVKSVESMSDEAARDKFLDWEERQSPAFPETVKPALKPEEPSIDDEAPAMDEAEEAIVEEAEEAPEEEEVVEAERPGGAGGEEGVPEAEAAEEGKDEGIEIPAVEEAVIEEPENPSLAGYIAAGVLPGNLTEAQIIQICNAVGIPATDLSFEITKEQLQRLTDDKVIQTAKMNQSIYSKRQEKAQEYDRLIAKYEAMITDPEAKHNMGPENIARIQQLIDKLKEEKKLLNETAKKYQEHADVEHIESKQDPIDRAIGIDHRRAVKSDKLNEQLREQYRELDKLQVEKGKAKSDRMKRRADRRIEKTLQRIQELKTKRGTYTAKQNAVINKHSDEYIRKTTEKIAAHEAAREQVTEIVEEREGYGKEIAGKHEEVVGISEDREMLDTSKIGDRLTDFGLRRDAGKLNRDIARLQSKRGSCDRRIQHIVDYGPSLSR